MGAAVDLFRTVGAEVVGSACIIELTFLQGRKRLDVPFSSSSPTTNSRRAQGSRFPLQRQWRLIAVGKRQTRNLHQRGQRQAFKLGGGHHDPTTSSSPGMLPASIVNSS